MRLNERIIQARKAKGFTQDELATLTKVNLRTIQRLESGKSKPRPYTLKAIEKALDFQQPAANNPEDTAHFLHLVCISCFSYLLIPYVHFLIPNYLLNRNKEQDPEIRRFARKVIRIQICWVVVTMLVFLTVLLINFLERYTFHTTFYISYLIPFFGMYSLNILLILDSINKARTLAVQMP
jgi:transcriptional regulator with XRE-family HTH domain